MRQPATRITPNLGNHNRKIDRTMDRFSSVLWIFSVHRTEPANTNSDDGPLSAPTDPLRMTNTAHHDPLPTANMAHHNTIPMANTTHHLPLPTVRTAQHQHPHSAPHPTNGKHCQPPPTIFDNSPPPAPTNCKDGPAPHANSDDGPSPPLTNSDDSPAQFNVVYVS